MKIFILLQTILKKFWNFFCFSKIKKKRLIFFSKFKKSENIIRFISKNIIWNLIFKIQKKRSDFCSKKSFFKFFVQKIIFGKNFNF